jgi:hypothetical protein
MQFSEVEILKYTIMGFQQLKLIEYKLSLEEAFLLRVIKDFYSSVSMESIIEDNKRYIWLKSDLLAKEVPIIGTLRNLKRKIEKLEDKGFIKRVLKHKRNGKGGTYLYMRPTVLVDILTDYEKDSKSTKKRDDHFVMEGMTELSSGGCQKCHTKDHTNKDPSNIYHKQQETPNSRNLNNIFSVVLNKNNLNISEPVKISIENIILNFKSITGRIPCEKDITDIYEILINPIAKKLDLQRKEKIVIKTISEIQKQDPNKQINSINYFKVPILKEFKEYRVFKIDNKLY